MKVLSTPSKVANALDWKKSIGGAIATMDVQADRIGITIAKHPSSASASSAGGSIEGISCSLPMKRKGPSKIPESSRQQLADLVKEHNVCGFVVSWPIQRDTGIMGAACGRTLFAIEELLSPPQQQSSSSPSEEPQQQRTNPVFTPGRPVCFWNNEEQQLHKVDSFGRSPVYARTSDKQVHIASKEQYNAQDESTVAVNVWDDFVQTNWPAIYQERQELRQEEQGRLLQQLSAENFGNGEEWEHEKKTMMAAA